MFDRIRAALGREETVRPPVLYLSEGVAPVATDIDLVQLFCDELEKVGGHVSLAATSAELKNCLERILVREMPGLVAVSDVVATTQADLLNTLAIKILKPVDTEFETYRRELLSAGIGITTADYAIADTGTLILLSGSERHRLVSLLPPVHICLLDSQRIFPNLTQLLTHLHTHVYSNPSPPQATTFITGPSRTADIEQTLTTGVHGPSRLEVVLTL
jgi:L-lactate dehydrogenase complex protein LldG